MEPMRVKTKSLTHVGWTTFVDPLGDSANHYQTIKRCHPKEPWTGCQVVTQQPRKTRVAGCPILAGRAARFQAFEACGVPDWSLQQLPWDCMLASMNKYLWH